MSHLLWHGDGISSKERRRVPLGKGTAPLWPFLVTLEESPLTPVRRPLLRFLLMLLGSLCLNLGCATTTSSTAQRELAATVRGGADPSGGEGQRSTPEQLRKIVTANLEELTKAFLRVGAYVQSRHPEDIKTSSEIRFLEPCFAKDSKDCRAGVFATILKMKKKFSERQIVSGDCPDVNRAHTMTDMSLTSDLDLCVSEKLNRYPPRELQRQVLSLLAHEVVHGLGFDETAASAMQYWALENQTILMPGSSFRAKFNALSATVDVRVRMLLRLLDFPPVQTLTFCEYAGNLALSMHPLNELYSSEDEDAVISVPLTIRGLGRLADKQILEIVVPTCIQKKPLGNGSEILKSVRVLMETLSRLKATIEVYSKTSRPQVAINPFPNDKTWLVASVVEQDLKGPEHSSSAQSVLCAVQGDETSIPLKKGGNVSLEKVFPGSSTQLKIGLDRLVDGRSLGVSLRAESSCEGTNLFCEAPLLFKILSSNATWSNDVLLVKVLGADREFRSLLQFQKREQSGVLQNTGAPVEIVCREGT